MLGDFVDRRLLRRNAVRSILVVKAHLHIAATVGKHTGIRRQDQAWAYQEPGLDAALNLDAAHGVVARAFHFSAPCGNQRRLHRRHFVRVTLRAGRRMQHNLLGRGFLLAGQVRFEAQVKGKQVRVVWIVAQCRRNQGFDAVMRICRFNQLEDRIGVGWRAGDSLQVFVKPVPNHARASSERSGNALTSALSSWRSRLPGSSIGIHPSLAAGKDSGLHPPESCPGETHRALLPGKREGEIDHELTLHVAQFLFHDMRRPRGQHEVDRPFGSAIRN